jgi:hypothetical protein
MRTVAVDAVREVEAPLYVPAGWQPAPSTQRDVALDLVRGLAMVILVVNHTRLESALGAATGALLSAAEVLVAVSGVVAGMVFGRRWVVRGARATSGMLLRRARKLYVASVMVVAVVGLARLVPGLATHALTVSPTMSSATDLYAFDGAARTALAIVTLEAGPWQFSILGFFIASIAATPLLLAALARGWWPAVVAGSIALFVIGRGLGVDVLPSQSERAFPLLVWQILFVNGLVLGWHRERIAAALRRHRRTVSAVIVAVALLAAGLRLLGPLLFDPDAWARWNATHFDKTSLDLARIVAMMAMAASLYLLLRRHRHAAERALGPLLLPFGRNSLYVFIMHVFACLAVASVPALAGGGMGLVGNVFTQLTVLILLWLMIRHRFLFRWVPR